MPAPQRPVPGRAHAPNGSKVVNPGYRGAGPVRRPPQQKTRVSQAVAEVVEDYYDDGEEFDDQTPPPASWPAPKMRGYDGDDSMWATARQAQQVKYYNAPKSKAVVPVGDPYHTRYQQAEPPAPIERHTDQYQRVRTRRRNKPALFIICAFGLFVVLFMLATAGLNALGSWWQDHQDYASYGYPRTFQIDAVVGLGDSALHPSHFIAINLNGQGDIIDFPGGDPSGGIVYNLKLAPFGDPSVAAKMPITVSFVDINGDQRPDMIVKIGHGGEVEYWINDAKLQKFRPVQPGEQINPPAA